MKLVKVHEAKTHLSRLLERVEAGEDIVIARHGKPVARLVPMSASDREPGRLAGKIRVGKNFDEPLPEEILAAFESGVDD
ncbi:MAG: type II toxin-antitoxin system prevent-host-death family antitoxin [Acidobacteria bacterium]|nr:type II toxin-antitoxin system prevent-host-death family antitoxin [Acidobacteriota bacterium]